MKKTEQINVRMTFEQRQRLLRIAEFEGVDLPELIRGWIREKIREHKIPKTWRKENEDRA